MDLVDVNVLVYAYRTDAPDHPTYRLWIEELIGGDQVYGMSDFVLGGFLRIVTHPRVFNPPNDIATALTFAHYVRRQPNCVQITPGPRHWDIFVRLCETAGARGNLVPDAYLAALAIESGSRWITTDRDFSRFQGLNWHHPLDG